MSPPLLWVWAGAGVAASWILTGGVRRYALARAILDVPNQRSSHSVPTPRGGGAAIAAVCLAGIALAAALGAVPVGYGVALAGGGAMIAAIGWIDDHRGISPLARAGTHFLAAAWALFWIGGLPELRVGSQVVPLGVFGPVLAAFAIVWCTNLYNFMDGIDGIAAGEAVAVGGIGGVLLLASGHPGLAAVAFAIAAASGGFLAWNWAPAKIFMGDVGSGLLGFLFGTLAVASERAGGVPLLVWVLLLGVFVFDATATLLRRVVRGERWYDAHRSHAYQRAVRAGWTHARVSSAVLVLNAVLGALAAAAILRPGLAVPALLAGAALLAVVYLLVERRNPMYGGV